MRTNLVLLRSFTFVLIVCLSFVWQATVPLCHQRRSNSPAQPHPSPTRQRSTSLRCSRQQVRPGQPSPARSKVRPNPREQAWRLLESACTSDKTTNRATAVLVLGLIPNNKRSAELAEKALTDSKPEVRSAAAAALGEMRSRSSIPKLRAAFDDQDPLVVLAAAHSLDLMHDNSAYEVYFEVLNGERKAGKGLDLIPSVSLA